MSTLIETKPDTLSTRPNPYDKRPRESEEDYLERLSQMKAEDDLTQQIRDAKDPKIALFDKCTDKVPSGCLRIEELADGIADGRWRAEVEACRKVLKKKGRDAYDELRVATVPAITLSAMLNHRRKGTTIADKGAVPSGYAQCDFDAKDHPGVTIDEIKKIVWSAPFVCAVFTSLSGDGVKAFARCPASFDTHLGSWLAAEAWFAERGLKMDPATKDPFRLCFVSYDPASFYFDEATEIVPFDVPEKSAATGASEGTEDPEHVRRVLEILSRKIGEHQDRNTWIHICACAKDAVGADAAEELVDEYFPPAEPHHQSAGDVVHDPKITGTWASLRKYEIDPVDYIRLMPDLSGEDEQGAAPPAKSAPSLRERAYAMRFNPNEAPPPDETCMMIGDVPIAARGNLTVLQGKSKVGKSAVVSAILGAAQRGLIQSAADALCIEWAGEGTGAIIHLDTEQSPADWHGLVSRSITRSGLPEVSDRLVSLPLVQFARSERMDILRQTLEYEHREKGRIDGAVIDGVADLCLSPNDEAEALEIVSQLMALAQKYAAPIFCILHENPSAQDAKTRGHLGSELNRKAFANLRIDKDTETSVSTIYGTDMRKRDIPKEQGFCFAWDEAARMHTFQGRAAGMKAAKTKERAVANARKEWEAIFEKGRIGTNLTCPALTPKEAAEVLRDIHGTEKKVTVDAMKKRMQRAESLGVLGKSGEGAWTLTPSGQSGQNRDI